MLTRTLRNATLCTLLLGLSSTALATDHLKLKSGRRLAGEATAYDDEKAIVTFVTTAGETLQLKADDLDPHSAYKLAKTKAEKGSAEDEFRMGNFAREIELYAHAARHFGNVLELDPSRAPAVEKAREQLRKEAAAFCMRNAREALRKGDDKEAEKWLTTLVEKLPGTPEAATASSLLAETYAKNHAAKDDHLEEAHTELITKELQTGKKHYDAMLKGIEKGLTNTRTTAVAKREFEGAFQDGERALKELDEVQKKLARDQVDVAELFDGYRELVREHMVASQLHLASLLTVQTDYKDAQKAVNKALSIDSTNKEALAARARIENVSNRGWGWR